MSPVRTRRPATTASSATGTIAVLLSLVGLVWIWHEELIHLARLAWDWISSADHVRVLLSGTLTATIITVLILMRRTTAEERADAARSQIETELGTSATPELVKARMKDAAADRRKKNENRVVLFLIITVLASGVSAGLFVYAKTPEVSERPPSRATQAIQSAALVTALSGGALTLWLSNRRRRHDEETLEQSRAELDQTRSSSESQLDLNRTRAEDERFTAAIELLGHDNSSVRVGALHVLHGLAKTATGRRQTVVDVMSAYLRQPFNHRDWGFIVGAEASDPGVEDREREVRRTALRLIIDLLDTSRQENSILVDLSAASIEDLDLSGRALRLRASGMELHGSMDLNEAQIIGPVDFNGATFHGAVNANMTTFSGEADFEGALFRDVAYFTISTFEERAKFVTTQFDSRAFFNQTHFIRSIDATQAVFGSIASFSEANMHGAVKFWGVRFEHETAFEKTRFGDFVDFSASVFRGETSFTESSFIRKCKFDGSIFKRAADFDRLKFDTSSPRVALDLSSANFEEQLSIVGTELTRVHLPSDTN